MKLTSKNVAGLQLPPGKKDVINFDDELAGFGYRIRAGADGKVNRRWIVQYRSRGSTRRLLLGSATVLNAEAARAAAKKALAEVALGGDTQGEKADRRGGHTRKAVIADYLAVKHKQVRPRTYRSRVRYLEGSYFRRLHSLPVGEITRKDVASQLTRIMVEHGNVTAMLARATLSAL